MIALHLGDCREVLRQYPDNHFDSCVDDAPYGLNDRIDVFAMMTAWMASERYEPNGSGFMGRSWDKCVPGPDTWREVFRVLKPGAHLLVFAGSKTVGLTEMAIRLAGFEIRDQMQWIYAEGMSKGSTLDKTIDKKLGAERKVVGSRKLTGNAAQTTKEKGGTYGANTDSRGVAPKIVDITEPGSEEAKQWEGWAPLLKPAHEPIIVARKPLEKGLTLTENVMKWGCGALNIDACRIHAADQVELERKFTSTWSSAPRENAVYGPKPDRTGQEASPLGRWPANTIFDAGAGAMLDEQSGVRPGMSGGGKHSAGYAGGMFGGIDGNAAHARGDTGGASRFFYQPKARPRARWARVTCECEEVPGWAKEVLSQNEKTVSILQSKDTCGEKSTAECDCSTTLFGSKASGQSHPGSKSTTRTTSGTTTESRISNSSIVSPINGRIQGVCCETACGGNPVVDARSSSQFQQAIGTSVRQGRLFMGVVGPVTSLLSLQRKSCEDCGAPLLVERHPTQKPDELMRYLVRLVTPPGGTCLDAHMGSGTTGVASKLEGLNFVGIEWEETSFLVAERRIEWWTAERYAELESDAKPAPKASVSQLSLGLEAAS